MIPRLWRWRCSGGVWSMSNRSWASQWPTGTHWEHRALVHITTSSIDGYPPPLCLFRHPGTASLNSGHRGWYFMSNQWVRLHENSRRVRGIWVKSIWMDIHVLDRLLGRRNWCLSYQARHQGWCWWLEVLWITCLKSSISHSCVE